MHGHSGHLADISLPASEKRERRQNIYCITAHLKIIELLIIFLYKLSAVTAALTLPSCKHTWVSQAVSGVVKKTANLVIN